MYEEIKAIEKNGTWELTPLPEGHKAISVKWNKDKDFLIVYLYVDDLIFMGSNPIMFGKFKEAMTKEFERTEIGLMAYYLSIEVNRREVGIFNSQEGYAREILKKFKMDNSKPINIPVEYGVKLSKHDKLEKVDPTLFKSLDSRYLQLKKVVHKI
ncbi:uncharacterized mitochondrial protein AtMg00810-like [Zingiber officinale]|uniref:uncharacterized mitochondrial protein AtMg00810-like n=1 Tax=Zingiber officinale TaxID=94328 RepID=UPI001C4D9837|nr:uncharacterized mitochondrial protein AtMg00810-like [Zingiber officinale]